MKNPFLVALALGAAGFLVYKTAFAATTVSINGHTWKLDKTDGGATNVYAPKGSWGPHAELLIIQFKDVGGQRILTGAGQDVPVAMRDAAMVDLGVRPPGA